MYIRIRTLPQSYKCLDKFEVDISLTKILNSIAELLNVENKM